MNIFFGLEQFGIRFVQQDVAQLSEFAALVIAEGQQ